MMQTFLKIYFLVLAIFLCSNIYATNHYADKNTNGNNNGITWTNAWESFASITWGSANLGDIVYISGGTDSTVYNERLNLLNVNGSTCHPILIRNSWDAGHNGRAIINKSGTNCILLGNANYSSYITLYGLEVRNGTKSIYIRNATRDITIDSCLVYELHTFGFQTEGNTGSGKNIKI